MSHDFAEAAYMGRSGYEVWLEPGLGGSYEESPPTLVDELGRDRRWAKGNMQHLWLMLRSRRLRFAHRMAFLNGIMAYLASPLWLCFLILTSIETTRLTLWPIDYFPDRHQLVPLWPEWHPEWAIGLVGATLTLLFLPKFLAVADALLSGRASDFGGGFKLQRSVFLEIIISTLLAPIRMLAHTRYVLEALLNRSLTWAGQNRSVETNWQAAFLSHAPGTVIALSWSSFAWWLDPMFFLWSLPVAIPLILAAPTSVILSRTQLGLDARQGGWLLIPEETKGSRLLDDLRPPSSLPGEALHESAFEGAVLHPYLNAIHRQLARPRSGKARRAHLDELCGQCLEQGPDCLDRRGKSLLAQDSISLERLHQQAWRAQADSPWRRLIDEHNLSR